MADSEKSSHEKELLRRARSGDPDALEALLQSVQPMLYRYSMKMCRQSQDAEDVLQDSMLALARSVRDFNGASSFSTWVYSITRNFCIKKRRKSKFAPKQTESLSDLQDTGHDAPISPGPNPEAESETLEVWKQVQRAIETLAPEDREVLVLRDVEGLSAKEVAEVTGLSVPAVKSRLHRSRSHVRDTLARPDTATESTRSPTCPDIRRVFSEHLEGDLSPQACATMESHVAHCPACSAECDGLKRVLGACAAAPAEVPKDVQARVQQGLRSALSRISEGLEKV